MQPSLEEVVALAAHGTTVPVYQEVLADTETPVSALLKLGCGPGSFLLESVEGGEHLGRYSFLGVEPESVLTLWDGEAELSGELGEGRLAFSDPLDLVDALLSRERPVLYPGLPRFHGGAVGYLSYDLVRYFERIPKPLGPGVPLPLGRLAWYKTVLAFDHLRRTIKIVTHVPTEGDVPRAYREASARLDSLVARLRSGSGPTGGEMPDLGSLGSAKVGDASLQSNVSRQRYEDSVRRVKEYIASGDAIQVVLSQRFSVPTRTSPLTLYRALRAVNPSPYMYFLDCGSFHIVGASPEMMVRVEDGTVSIYPIAGTRRRGRTADEDERLAAELSGDEKEMAEHVMLVDLGRNDVGRVSEPGSVRVTRLMGVERYSHVMHLVSHVEGRLRKGLRPVDALRAGFPAGTVSGAPKVRAMEIISELEPDARGPYAGAVGYLGFDGNLDTAITIRTVVMMDGVAHVQVGAGVVADSVPELEYEETVNKAAAMLRSLQAAESMDASRESRRDPAEAGVEVGIARKDGPR